MAINQALPGDFDHEMANSRTAIGRVPDEKFDWKPHTKSMAMGALAAHIAFIPHWAALTVQSARFDVNPPGGPGLQPPELKTRAQVLALFDKAVPEARAAIAGASDENLMTPWSLLSGGKPIFTMPRVNDIPALATYGPSADEGGM